MRKPKPPNKVPYARQYRWQKHDYTSSDVRNGCIAITMTGVQIGYTYQHVGGDSGSPCWIWKTIIPDADHLSGSDWIEAGARKAVNDIAIKAGYLPINPKLLSMI